MDMKHRKSYARVTIRGVKEPIILNDGVGLAQLLIADLSRVLRDAPNKYDGVEVEIRFSPININETAQQRELREMIAMIPPEMIEMATDEEEALYAEGNPSDPKSHIYDPLYFEWVKCASSQYRESKTPTDLQALRLHVEQKYLGTRWFGGAHKW